MSNTHEVEYHYKTSADAVYERLTDPQFLTERRHVAGDTNVDVIKSTKNETVFLKLTCDAAPELPAFARKLFARLIRVTDNTEWRKAGNGYHSIYDVEVAGGVGRLEGETFLTSTETGCILRERFRASIKMPLLRRRLEQLMVREAEKAMLGDCAYLDSVLAKSQASGLG